MLEWLQTIIPVSLPLLILFFLLPFTVAFVVQILLCRTSTKLIVRLTPFIVAAVMVVVVFLNRMTGVLDRWIGGFVSLLLLGSALSIVCAAVFVWFIFLLIRVLRK